MVTVKNSFAQSKQIFFLYNIIKLTFLYLCLFISTTEISAQESNNQSNLARIAIISFADQTNSPNYAYLSESIVDAIDSSMKSKFVYERIAPEKIKNYITSKKIINITDKNEVYQVAKNFDADIALYGTYSLNEETNEIIISIYIYFLSIEDHTTLKPVRSKVDSSLFQATDIVAQNIVDEINHVVEKYQNENKNNSIATEDESGKKIVTTDTLKSRTKVWGLGAYSKWTHMEPGVNIFSLGLYSEQFYTQTFSGYGTLGYSISKDYNYVKIPSIGTILILSILFVPSLQYLIKPSMLLIDGFSYHWKVAQNIYLSPYLGLRLDIPVKQKSLRAFNGNAPYPVLFGYETGINLNYSISSTMRLGLAAGVLYIKPVAGIDASIYLRYLIK